MLKLLNIYIILFTLLIGSIDSTAAILRVNNNPNSSAPYSDIQSAVTNANPGDIIYLEGNSLLGGATALVPYPAVVVDKALHFVGPGYFLAENYPNANLIQSAICTQFSFIGGSQGSVVEGILVDQVNIGVDNITIKKNRIHHLDMVNASACIIAKNFLEGTTPFDPVIFMDGGGGHIFQSNLMTHDPAFTSGQYVIHENNTSLNEYQNNILKNGNSITNEAFFHNNIFVQHSFEMIELGTFNNNIFGSGPPPVTLFDPFGSPNDNSPIVSDPSNQLGVDITTVFVGGANGGVDSDYQLLNISPALGAGDNGEDIGMYPLTNPYTPSGLPDIPILTIFNSIESSSTYLIPLTYFGFSPDEQAIVVGEYYLDSDPDYGNGVPFTFTAAAVVDGNLAMDIQGLTPGAHTFGFRIQDVLGQWSHDVEHSFQVENPTQDLVPALSIMEYFIDIDEGYDTGTIIDNPAAGDIDGDFSTSIDLSGYAPGYHTIGIRAMDEDGSYGTTLVTPIIILTPNDQIPPPVVSVEYFFDDNDPGFGVSEFFVPVTGDDVFIPIVFSAHNLDIGLHQLHLRPLDANGEWGTTFTTPVLITPDQSDLVELDHFEYFVGDDPGFGDGSIIDIPAGQTEFDGTLNFDLTAEDLGEHDLQLRVVDVEGNWSTTHIEVLLINTDCEQVDLDGSGTVDILDLLGFLSDFGCTDPPCAADFNMDGTTDALDLIFFLGYYSQTCQ